MKNVLNKDEKEEYKCNFFTAEGYNTLLIYTKELTKEFFKREKKDYPFKLGIVLGIPHFYWASEFEDKLYLESRIKGFMQILGINEVSIKIKDSEMTLSYGVKDDS